MANAGIVGAGLIGRAYVQESGPEVLDAKRATFEQLDRAAGPGTILASSTSAIVASKFTEALVGRARCIVAHPVNPPTSCRSWSCAARRGPRPRPRGAREILAGVGQVPIEVNAPSRAEIAEKSLWRDARLAALVAHKRAARPHSSD